MTNWLRTSAEHIFNQCLAPVIDLKKGSENSENLEVNFLLGESSIDIANEKKWYDQHDELCKNVKPHLSPQIWYNWVNLTSNIDHLVWLKSAELNFNERGKLNRL